MKTTLAYLQNLFPKTCHDHISLVGGSVRDLVLGLENKDLDLTTTLSEDELQTFGFRRVEGKSTTPIWFRSDNTFGKIEATRIDSIDDLPSDLARRDFTINAMAMSLDGHMFDPLDGQGDLDKKLLRACSPLSFRDDPLRIFRAFRFEADGWRMTAETGKLIREQDWSEELDRIPVERFSREMLKALGSPEPQRFFQLMLEFKVGRSYLPELFRMPFIPAGPLQHHPEGDLFTHSIQVLERLATQADQPLARFCAFFHDLGKLATDPTLFPKHHGHDEQGFQMARRFCKRLRLPAEYSKALAWTSRLHGILNRWPELRNSTRIKTAEQALNGGIVEILPKISAADKADTLEIAGWQDAVRIAGMTTAELGIDQEKLERMLPESRGDFILQRRVEKLRKTTPTSSSEISTPPL
ncbi:MAG TPA: HD domain-containing protein [Desulfuromonadaceae bacterium]|jgi:tRNA nucleotidyltransferase (CCA-adding enzyme)